MAVIPWSPLAGGWLTGKYQRGQEPQAGSRYDPDSPFMQGTVSSAAERAAPVRFDAVDALRDIADKAGITLTELAMAFVASHPAITSTIIGPRTMKHLEDALTAADVDLGEDVLDAVDEVVPPGTDLPGVDHFTQYPSLQPAARRRPSRVSV